MRLTMILGLLLGLGLMPARGLAAVPVPHVAGHANSARPAVIQSPSGRNQTGRVLRFGVPPAPVRAAGSMTQARASLLLARRGLTFEPNRGQFPRQVAFAARGPDFTVYLTAGGATLDLHHALGKPGAPGSRVQSMAVRMSLRGARHASPTGMQRLPGVLNYLVGRNPRAWHTHIPTYAAVSYRNVYPGIDLRFTGAHGALEYNWVIHPGARVSAIEVAMSGAHLRLDARHNLLMGTGLGPVLQSRPSVFQTVGAHRVLVPGRFVLVGHTIRFAVGAYDRSRPLVIDPNIVYGSYFGGSADDEATSIAFNPYLPAAFVTGVTDSSDFPTSSTTIGNRTSSGYDGWVIKMSPSGTVQYETILGGGDGTVAPTRIALNTFAPVAIAYIGGYTTSSTFPVTTGTDNSALQPQLSAPGAQNGFVATLSADGSQILYATYLGAGTTGVTGLSVDQDDLLTAAGNTNAGGFPVTPGAYQPAYAGQNGATNGFVVVINPGEPTTGRTQPALNPAVGGPAGIDYGTYFGGASSLTVTAATSGNVSDPVTIAGYGASSTIPTTPWPTLHTLTSGGLDGFVASFSPSRSGASSLSSSSLIGGSGDDKIEALSGATGGGYSQAWIAGETTSPDLPMVHPLPGLGAFHSCTTCPEGFLMAISTYGIQFSTYLGGSGSTTVRALAKDVLGNVYVDGSTDSADLPTKNAVQAQYAGGGTGGNDDGFVAEVNSYGTNLVSDTYLGGSAEDYLTGIAVDSSNNSNSTGNIWLSGVTYSSGLFGQSNNPGSNADGMVAALSNAGAFNNPFGVGVMGDYPLVSGRTTTVNTALDLPPPCEPSAISLNCAMVQAGRDGQGTVAFSINPSGTMADGLPETCHASTIQGQNVNVCVLQQVSSLWTTSLWPKITVNGYTQPGARPNTNALNDPSGDNAILTIQLDGSNADGAFGCMLPHPDSTSYDCNGDDAILPGDGDVIQGLSITNWKNQANPFEPWQCCVDAGVGISGGNNVTLVGNWIGLTPEGVPALVDSGIGTGAYEKVGGAEPADRNVVLGRDGDVAENQIGNSVDGNYIGIDAAGHTVGGVGSVNGASMSDGTPGNPNILSGNVISGNQAVGVSEFGAYDVVQGNFIGTDITGTTALPNAGCGIVDGARYDTISGNTVGGNALCGIQVVPTDCCSPVINDTISGNWIGVTANGTAIPNGPSPSTVPGNFYNTGDGILVLGRPSNLTISGNTIANNTGFGVQDDDETASRSGPNTIAGNTITQNGQGGIGIVGGTRGDVVSQNTIFQNSGPGVYVGSTYNAGWGPSRVQITQNSTYGNTGLGIDLAPEGTVNCTTANTTPPGPDDYINCPVINTANTGAVSGTACPGCTVEVFVADGSTPAEGKTYIGSAVADLSTSSTPGAWTLTLNQTGQPQATPGMSLVATATGAEEPSGTSTADMVLETSEFSTALPVASLKPAPPAINTVDGWPVSGGGDPLQGTWISGGGPTITGTGGAPGGQIEIFLDPGSGGNLGQPICVATVNADGTWTCTPGSGFTWPDGPHSLVPVTCDTNNNCSDAGQPTYVRVDSTPPTIGISGSCLDGNTPSVSITDSGSGVNSGKTAYLLDGNAYTPWTPAPGLGAHTLEVIAYDNVGNKADVSFSFNCQDTTSIQLSGSYTSDYHDAVTMTATLMDMHTNQPVTGEALTFSFGDSTCSTDSTGTCQITPDEPADTYPMTVAFGGDSKYLASSNTGGSFVVTLEQTALTSTANTTLVQQGGSVQLSATLTEDTTSGAPIANRQVTLTLGNGSNAQSCSATTDGNGRGTCVITGVNQPLGPEPITDSFAGDGYYQAATHAQNALVYALPANGQFVLGDTTVSTANSSTSLYFWGSQWWSNNSLSGTPAGTGPSAFKGFDDSSTVPVCGSTWTTDPGNSSAPPAAVPSYMGVIVSSTVAQSGSAITGDIKKVVIVKTNAGYASDPGDPGTGTIVATLCG